MVGRWKAKLTRAVGHAGAIAGSGDDAAAKEKWFLETAQGKEAFTPENRVVSQMGAVVTNIAHIPMALTEVMKLNGVAPDFPPEGDLTLKPWFGNNQGLPLPPVLEMPVVKAFPPYDQQIAEHDPPGRRDLPAPVDEGLLGQFGHGRQESGHPGQRNLDPRHGQAFRWNLTACLALLHEFNDDNDNALFNLAVASGVNLHGDMIATVADAARAAGNSPNTVLSAACALMGPARVEGACAAADTLIDLFAQSGLDEGGDAEFKVEAVKASPEQRARLVQKAADPAAAAMLAAFKARGGKIGLRQFPDHARRPPDRRCHAGGADHHRGLARDEAEEGFPHHRPQHAVVHQAVLRP